MGNKIVVRKWKEGKYSVFRALTLVSSHTSLPFILQVLLLYYASLITLALKVQLWVTAFTLFGSASICHSFLRLCRIFRRSPRHLDKWRMGSGGERDRGVRCQTLQQTQLERSCGPALLWHQCEWLWPHFFLPTMPLISTHPRGHTYCTPILSRSASLRYRSPTPVIFWAGQQSGHHWC